MQVPKRRSEQFKKSATGPVYLTQGKYDELSYKLARLKDRLSGLIAEVERTKQFGDFSENAEYQAAKKQLRGTHARIFELEHQLERAQIIKKGSASGRVEIGSKVVLASTLSEFSYEILGSHESDPARGRISHVSPLGQALLGQVAGAEIEYDTPRGRLRFKILKIE